MWPIWLTQKREADTGNKELKPGDYLLIEARNGNKSVREP